MKRRKRGRKQSGYAMTRDLLNVTPSLIVGTSVAGMIPKLYP